MMCFRVSKLGVLCVFLGWTLVSWGLATDVPKQGRPPKGLSKQPDGHWSPYNSPPAAEGDSVHHVERGETLWGLAGKYLQDPNLWPQIWEANSHVKNPHWIYPGDTILIKKQVVVTEERLKEEMQKEPASVTEEPSSSTALSEPVVVLKPRVFEVRRPGAVAISGRDLYCSGFITQQSPPMGTFVVGAEEESLRARYVEGDIIYINKGRRQEMIPGAEFAIVRPLGAVKTGPKRKQNLGNYVAEMGKARLLVVHANSATAQVVFSCDSVLIGDMLIPFTNKRSPLSKVSTEFDENYALQRYSLSGRLETVDNREVVVPANAPAPRAFGQIVLAKEDLQYLGEGHIVYVDLGKQVGLSPGDVLAVYRDANGFGAGGLHSEASVNSTYEPESLGYRAASKKAINNRAVPNKIVGELVVLHVTDNSATTKVVYAQQEIQIGDKVALLR